MFFPGRTWRGCRAAMRLSKGLYMISLTTTSYAILGLLAVKPWSTYELTQQMDHFTIGAYIDPPSLAALAAGDALHHGEHGPADGGETDVNTTVRVAYR